MNCHFYFIIHICKNIYWLSWSPKFHDKVPEAGRCYPCEHRVTTEWPEMLSESRSGELRHSETSGDLPTSHVTGGDLPTSPLTFSTACLHSAPIFLDTFHSSFYFFVSPGYREISHPRILSGSCLRFSTEQFSVGCGNSKNTGRGHDNIYLGKPSLKIKILNN